MQALPKSRPLLPLRPGLTERRQEAVVDLELDLGSCSLGALAAGLGLGEKFGLLGA